MRLFFSSFWCLREIRFQKVCGLQWYPRVFLFSSRYVSFEFLLNPFHTLRFCSSKFSFDFGKVFLNNIFLHLLFFFCCLLHYRSKFVFAVSSHFIEDFIEKLVLLFLHFSKMIALCSLFYLSLSLPFSLFLFLSLSLSSLSLSLSLPATLFLHVTSWRSMLRSVPLCLCMSFYVSLCLSVSLCVSWCLSVSMCVFPYLSASFCVSLSFFPLSVFPSLPLSSLPFSRSLSRPTSPSSFFSLIRFQSLSPSAIMILTRTPTRFFYILSNFCSWYRRVQ